MLLCFFDTRNDPSAMLGYLEPRRETRHELNPNLIIRVKILRAATVLLEFFLDFLGLNFEVCSNTREVC